MYNIQLLAGLKNTPVWIKLANKCSALIKLTAVEKKV